MYPTVVVVLIEKQRSMADVCEFIPSNLSKLAGPVESDTRHATLGHLSFVVRPIRTLMDNILTKLNLSTRVRCRPKMGRKMSRRSFSKKRTVGLALGAD